LRRYSSTMATTPAFSATEEITAPRVTAQHPDLTAEYFFA
jgi:hypothetical protein